ncbi:hypothetical protein C8J57DRAFT_489502 [Mycena rebaudengoi]|nr:hypothetical protein C8J57DRAFT_489502 [Mycena rebaudengoi]
MRRTGRRPVAGWRRRPTRPRYSSGRPCPHYSSARPTAHLHLHYHLLVRPTIAAGVAAAARSTRTRRPTCRAARAHHALGSGLLLRYANAELHLLLRNTELRLVRDTGAPNPCPPNPGYPPNPGCCAGAALNSDRISCFFVWARAGLGWGTAAAGAWKSSMKRSYSGLGGEGRQCRDCPLGGGDGIILVMFAEMRWWRA